LISQVLVVDDDAQIRRALATALKRVGFEVTTSDGYLSAIELAQTAAFELLVVDFNMRTALTGADVVRHFKQQRGQRVYCVVLSGEDSDRTRAACLDAGADHVLMKPCSIAELHARLVEATQTLRGMAA